MAAPSGIAFTISVDTEEDNWLPVREGITVRNIFELPRLMRLFETLGVRATFFTTYRVAADVDAAAVLREFHTGGNAEIGAHLHPWNTPPFCGIEHRVSMLRDYPEPVQQDKIGHLSATIEANVGCRPTSFRAGRFGFGRSTVAALIRNGILIDSSVTPFLSWEESDGGPCFVDAPGHVYRLDGTADVCKPVGDGVLVEVPITVGYTRFRRSSWPALTRILRVYPVRWARLGGLAARAGLVGRVILSPETNSVRDMVRMSRRLIESGARHLHMFFHSNSLVPGLSPFVRTRTDVARLYDAIERYVDELGALSPMAFCTVTEAAGIFAACPDPAAAQAEKAAASIEH